MSYQLKERPHSVSYSKNPIRYKVEVSNPDAPGCAVEIELYAMEYQGVYDPVTFPGTLVARQTLFPNPDGTVYFYAEDYLNSHLDWELPSIYVDLDPGNIFAVQNQLRKFYIRYRAVSKSNPSPEWATDADNMRLVLKGGVAKEKFDRNNFFANYLPEEKPFLTWQPSDHFIGANEVRYLSYFHNSDSTPTLKMKVRVVFLDGTESVAFKDFPALTETRLFHLPTSIRNVQDAIESDQQIWYYEVSVVDGASVYANPYRLFVDYRKYYNEISFVYHNSLGGIDTLRVRGDYDVELVREFTEIEKATGGDFSQTELPTEITAINISKYEVYKGDAGFFNTIAMQDSLQDLLLTESCFRIVGNRWLRVMQMQKGQQLRGTEDSKWSFPLQWRYTFNNTQYTPSEKNFGDGESTAIEGPVYGVCTAPENLAVTPGENPGEFELSWDPVAGAEGYEVDYKEDDAAEWTTVENDTNSLSIDLDTEGQYIWRVRTKCGENDYSGYATGPGFEYEEEVTECSAPSNLATTLQSLDPPVAMVQLSWSAVPGVSGYVVNYRQLGAPTWSSANTTGTTLVFVANADTQYEWRVRSKCDEEGNYSGYVYADPFIPSNMVGSCSKPSNLSAQVHGSILAGMLTFAFTGGSGAGSYQIQYRRKGLGDPWTNINGIVSSPHFQFVSPLPDDTTWEWRMRSNCTDGGFSEFINGPDFNS